MNLAPVQIRSLLDGAEEIFEIQEKSRENTKSGKTNVENKSEIKDGKTVTSKDDLAKMLVTLGGSVKMTGKAKKALEKLSKKPENK